MKVEIKGGMPTHPKHQVEAVEYVAHTICQATGKKADEGVMMLLTAAAQMAIKHSDGVDEDFLETIAKALGSAVVVAEGFLGQGSKTPAPAKFN